VWYEEEEEEEGEIKGHIVFCMQAEHAGTRTTTNSEATTPTAELHGNTLVTKGPEPHTQTHTYIKDNGQTTDLQDTERGPRKPAHHKVNGVDAMEMALPSTSPSEQEGRMGVERGERGERGGPGPAPHPHHQPNGWGPYGPPNGPPHHGNGPHQDNGRPPQGPPEGGMREGREMREQPENTGLLNRGVPADYYSVYDSVGGGPGYVEEYPLYPPGVRPDSICSVSAVGYDRLGPPRWTNEEKRCSLRDGPPLYGLPPPRDPYSPPPGPAYYSQMDAAQTSMRRLSIQPRSRSVPRSPSSSSGGPYSPGPHSFASPVHSPSARFDRGPSRLQEDVIYADPSVYGLRRSLSSPKYDYPGDRRSLSQGMYHYNNPASPSLHSKMEDILDLQLQRNLEYLDQQVPQFHDPYRELHPTLKRNEMETSKLLGRLCEQNSILKDQEAVVHRLRMDKVLTTTRMEFETLEDEVNAIHGDLWEQLNTGGQSEMIHRHIQKEFWRVQDVPLSPFSPLPGSQASPTKQLGPEDIGPPRPPLPKSYYPLELLPSLPRQPFDSSTWLRSQGLDDGYVDDEESRGRKHKYGYRQDMSPGEWTNSNEAQELDQDRQANTNK
ncbi:unnamed protein product, partial [Coregonus sp. 'balchen']